MKKRFILSTIALIFISTTLFMCQGTAPAQKALSYESLEKKLKTSEEILLIDVRTPEEYESGHIPGALNIPLSDTMAGFNAKNKDAEIILYCRSGSRAGRALGILKEQGYTNVTNFGGISNWKGEIVKGANP